MTYRKWSDDDLIVAVKNSKTKTEVLTKIGLKSRNSGNYQTIEFAIKRLNLDTSHFINEHMKITPSKTYSINEILIKNSPYSSTKNLKRKLLKAGLLKEECYNPDCGLTQWLGQKIVLQLDHINGDRTDNRIENLRLLCPNCHSLTPTYCKGKKNNKSENI